MLIAIRLRTDTHAYTYIDIHIHAHTKTYVLIQMRTLTHAQHLWHVTKMVKMVNKIGEATFEIIRINYISIQAFTAKIFRKDNIVNF